MTGPGKPTNNAKFEEHFERVVRALRTDSVGGTTGIEAMKDSTQRNEPLIDLETQAVTAEKAITRYVKR